MKKYIFFLFFVAPLVGETHQDGDAEKKVTKKEIARGIASGAIFAGSSYIVYDALRLACRTYSGFEFFLEATINDCKKAGLDLNGHIASESRRYAQLKEESQKVRIVLSCLFALAVMYFNYEYKTAEKAVAPFKKLLAKD